MVEEGLILSRFFHFAALLFVFGNALFPLYAFGTAESQACAGGTHRLRSSIFAASLLALVSGAGWLFFASASMAGSLSEALSPEIMGTVLLGTAFGKIWSARLGLVAALAVVVRLDKGHRPLSLAVLSAACLASLAGAGHTQAQDGVDFLVHSVSDGAHLLAAGAWLGGLVSLLALLWRPDAQARLELDAIPILMRFSGLGTLAVAVLIATGAINGWYAIGSVRQLPASLYGQLLIAKLGLFTLMLLLAAMNRFWLIPALRAGNGREPRAARLPRLRSHAMGEQVLGLAIVAVVSVLGTQDPRAGEHRDDAEARLIGVPAAARIVLAAGSPVAD